MAPPYYCGCGTVHLPGCPLGNTGGGGFARPLPAVPDAPTRGSWECHRCRRVNAPHVDQCECAHYAANVASITITNGAPATGSYVELTLEQLLEEL